MGAASSGKNTISRILTNYSAKIGWETVYVDLDPENNEISALGTISAATFNEYMPVT
jgi:polynucleotide 5'-kinase involved in rRNA processing